MAKPTQTPAPTPTQQAKPTATPVAQPAEIAPAPRKVRPNVADPISITFLTGQYKGMGLNVGTSVLDVSHDQTADWPEQPGYSSRTGVLFKNISPRTITLQLEFLSEQSDVSALVENVATLHEIDPDTGKAPLLIYQEGTITISPVYCASFRVKKEHPFYGAQGFRYATVDLTLKLFGGATSEHRLAKPLTKTELTEAKSRLTAAERDRLGIASVIQTGFIKCLGQQASEKVSDLIKQGKLSDPNTLKGLDSATLVNLAVAGLIPQDVLTQIAPNVQAAIAVEMAKKTDGVGTHGAQLAGAISGGSDILLPADLKQQLQQKRSDYSAITEAVLKQDLSEQSAVLQQRTSNAELISIAGCGLSVREAAVKSSAGGLGGDLNPDQQKYFDKELGPEAAKDPTKRDGLVLSKINDTLGKSDDEIKKAFGLGNADQIKALKNGQPYKSKDEFVKRASGLNSGVAGLSVYTGFLNQLVSTGATNGLP